MVEPSKSLEEGIRTCNVVALYVWFLFDLIMISIALGVPSVLVGQRFTLKKNRFLPQNIAGNGHFLTNG